jgi:hypothetical protein
MEQQSSYCIEKIHSSTILTMKPCNARHFVIPKIIMSEYSFIYGKINEHLFKKVGRKVDKGDRKMGSTTTHPPVHRPILQLELVLQQPF